MDVDASLARTARTLARDYAPTWGIPPGLEWFTLPDREVANILRIGDLPTLRSLRGIASDRLDAIEDGSYYIHRGAGVDGQRSRLDRAEAYHRLWWCDVFIGVYSA